MHSVSFVSSRDTIELIYFTVKFTNELDIESHEIVISCVALEYP